ncbi:hypothetical protein EDB81DRAFT_917121 [Dactylonectria macrodidyma]|uniref:Uncharacterized protein n=1 Tax=Dactylonectria macrodidyma TaxID=307937 RepID=A0A9P9DCG7_9HYPO|nr:hypothetical protein EDB81DRAFT_917121 [Dactylonectria macrodidyma]
MDHPLKIKQWDPSKLKRKPNLHARNPELRSALSNASFAQSIACDTENPWPFIGGEDLTNVDPYAGFPSIEEIIDEVIRSATIDNARDSINTPNHAATLKAISNSIPPYPGDKRAGNSVKTLSLQNNTPKCGSNSQNKEQGICKMSPKYTIAPVVKSRTMILSPCPSSLNRLLRQPRAQAGGTSGQSGLSPMAMDLSQHASSTQEPEVCSSGKQPVDNMRWGRDRCGGDVEPCSTGLGGSRTQAPRQRARGSYMLHGDYYKSDDSDGDDNNDNDERGQQSLELDGADRSRRCSGSIPIKALLDDAKYHPAQSTEDSERDHNGDEDEDEDEAYGKRRGKRRHSHKPLASIKRRRYGYTTR